MIFVFSGTGNSHSVATQLSRLLDDNDIVTLRGEMLYDPLNCRIAAHGERIIWVFPTYSWGIPPVVVRFIKEAVIDGAESRPHYMVTTCGDDIGETAAQWRKLIKSRRWQPASAYTVIMPNTYVFMKGFDVDSDDLAKQKLAEAPAVVEDIASRIKGHVFGDILIKGSCPWIKSNVIYPYFKRFCMSPKPFKINGRCVSCGKCAAECPMDNITLEGGRPEWHERCALCHRCYHICPAHAVEYGSATRDKGYYFLE